ncbi:hypothetical protein SEA_NIGHTMARE_74 [Arthrobacter phage Nightmare]|uniref:Uncharacterized protein n=1 Tax=Arthrobacter phage Nightmare TaxID=2015864 RepID=A0A221J6L6_9CAUD|nr:hypothetical protein QCN33_gp74 [Arthrobacter phage Nightmare]ASM62347.1 hypothetical protein SEA_NIGHTMARE_74 [Arthrobacter phage Nightmare]
MTNEVTPQPHENPVVLIPLYDRHTGIMLKEVLEVDVDFFLSSTQGLRSEQARVVDLDFPDPTPEQEIEILNRLACGLPMIPEGVKLYDVNSLYPTEFFSDWYQIPNYSTYEMNSGGQVRNRSSETILDYESLPGKWIRLRSDEGEYKIVSVDELLNEVFGV